MLRFKKDLSLRKRMKTKLIVAFIIWICVFVSLYPHRSTLVKTITYAEESKKYVNTFSEPRNVHNDAKGLHEPEQSNIGHTHSSYGHCQSDDFLHMHSVNISSLKYFQETYSVLQAPFSDWLKQKDTYCSDTIQVYGNVFGQLFNVKINPQERHNVDNLAKGGEKVQDVKSQTLNKEDYVLKKGFFEIACTDKKDYERISSSASYDRLKQLRTVDNMFFSGYTIEERWTVAIVRGDYANLWNHMFELYGVFVLMMIFNKQPKDVSILFLDGHPDCMLDKNWEHIFGPIQRVGHFQEPVVYKSLVWGLAENKIPLSLWKNPSCPYVEEFRDFILSQYGIVENAKQLNCKRLTFTFIVRRNQVYHPRNLEGNVERKIFNELEVIETLMDRFPGVCIQALLMESIPMRAQLEIISETDVLIGMHGAGMMHTTFLPRHAGAVELFPREWRQKRKHSIMYEVLTDKWRKMHYGSWQNPDTKRDFSEKVTIVDVDRVFEEVNVVINKMCKE